MEKSKSTTIMEFLLGIIAILSCIGTYLAVPGLAPVLFVTPSPKPTLELIERAIQVSTPTQMEPDTPLNSVLEPGQAWLSSGRELILLHVNQNQSPESVCKFSLELTFKNNTAVEQIIAVNPGDFILIDGTGMEWSGIGASNNHNCSSDSLQAPFIGRIQPNGIWNFAGGNSWIVWFDNSVLDNKNSTFMVRIKNILPVNAYWKFEIRN